MDGDENKNSTDTFSFAKSNAHRDSIDTLELIKESSYLSLDTEKQSEYDDEDYDELKTLSNGSSSSIEAANNIKTNQEDEKSEKNGLSTKTNESAISSIASFNLENKLNPLPNESYSKTQDESNITEDEIDTSDLNHLEPKLREAWIQMRKLDKKLAAVLKREKQVKRETVALIEKNRAELELLRITTDHKESKLEAENTAHFLALSYVDLDDDLEKDMDSNNPDLLTPLFKTQLPDLDESSRLDNDKNESIKNSATTPTKSETTNSTNNNNNDKFETNSASTKSNRTKTSSNNEKPTKPSNSKISKEKGKDFIKRNIKLAQDAGGVLAMTEEEKQRLNELLLDMDNIDSDKQISNLNQASEGDNLTFVVEYNPSAISLAQGDGFTPNKEEMEKLKRINTALEKRNYSRLTTSRVSSIQFSQTKSAHTIESDLYDGLIATESKQIKLNDEFDENEFGDKFIREARLSREQEVRLKYVDSQLEKLKSISSSEQDNRQSESNLNSENDSNSALSFVNQEQIKQLIDEYYSENSQNILENGNREFKKLAALKEENDSNLENLEDEFNNDFNEIPQVNENVIKKLLDEAKIEGIYQAINSNDTDRSVSEMTERSYYEEALEIIKARQSLIPDHVLNDQTVPKDEYNETNNDNKKTENDIKIEENFGINQSYQGSSSTKSNLADSNQFYNEEKLEREKLPPLTNKNNENLELIREDSRMSFVSSISNTNSTILPKIDSRYLPK